MCYNGSMELIILQFFETIRSDAQQYNEYLYQSNGAYVGEIHHIFTDEYYNGLLNVTGNGMMGAIEIPKIDVHLPIFHGTSDEVLNRAVGHVQGSSLPVGGENTRCILTGHSGLANAKLFTRLDELVVGDYIYLNVLDQILAYQVSDVQVIEPEEVDKVQIIPEKDLVSLITCTPFGINSHRLVVTGERVDYIEEEYEQIEENIGSPREIVFNMLPFLLIGVVTYSYLRERKKDGKNEAKD